MNKIYLLWQPYISEPNFIKAYSSKAEADEDFALIQQAGCEATTWVSEVEITCPKYVVDTDQLMPGSLIRVPPEKNETAEAELINYWKEKGLMGL